MIILGGWQARKKNLKGSTQLYDLWVVELDEGGVDIWWDPGSTLRFFSPAAPGRHAVSGQFVGRFGEGSHLIFGIGSGSGLACRKLGPILGHRPARSLAPFWEDFYTTHLPRIRSNAAYIPSLGLKYGLTSADGKPAATLTPSPSVTPAFPEGRTLVPSHDPPPCPIRLPRSYSWDLPHKNKISSKVSNKTTKNKTLVLFRGGLVHRFHRFWFTTV